MTTVTRDRASAYAKAVEEVLLDCMQIADRFHLHQNLMDAVKKIPGREIPVTNAVPVEMPSPVPNTSLPKDADAAPESVAESDEGKKIPIIVDNLTESEKNRLELIHKIQELYQ